MLYERIVEVSKNHYGRLKEIRKSKNNTVINKNKSQNSNTNMNEKEGILAQGSFLSNTSTQEDQREVINIR